ncbi:hypothetical protein [Psychromonas aquimarina]|uniref:hypothetical protein n=1 Tax=Psychromonas aquimarina TaxID=444919 RepID=UPI00048E9733|nr:hypothetical protein [Psychromonas aquimarina]
MKKRSTPVTDVDLSGKNRIVRNTLISWASHLVLVVSGFIMPRLMHEYIGQVQLGIWDFCWALISYLSLIGLGIGASSNRYVAKYNAEHKTEDLSKLISSTLAIEVFISLTILLGTLTVVYTMPLFFAQELGENVFKTQSVMFYLGLSLTITTLFSISRGLLTGHHRWDLHNALTAGFSVLSLIIMMTMLMSGFGLVGMAQGYLASTLIVEMIRIIIASQYTKQISISPSNICKELCWELLGFSAKGKLAVLPPVVLLQSVNILIVNAFGPAVLAVFARPLALTRHISTFMVKFTMILTPTAGAMLSEDKAEELQSFFLTTTKFSFAFTLPLVIALAVFGDIVITFWMGADYANWLLIAVLSLGALLPTAQDSSLRIMIAKNIHGKISIYMSLIVLMVFFILYLLFIENNFNLITAACLLIIPSNLAYGLALPLYACKKLSIPVRCYLSKAVFKPVIATLPYAALLGLAKYYYLQYAYLYSGMFFVFACFSLAFFYSVLLLNKSEKNHLWNKIR